MPNVRIAMAQMNPVVGDLKGNAAKILRFAGRARLAGADLVVLPELALTGYPPEDLLLKPGFVDDNIAELKKLSRRIKGVCAIIGFVDRKGGCIYNAAAIINRGVVMDVYHKMFLPNYGVFDEERYFKAGKTALNFILNGITSGVGICEDIWFERGPARAQARAGADVIVNINASPFHIGKDGFRQDLLVKRALGNRVAVVYNNMTGAQDELVFDGRGMIIDEKGVVLARGKAFEQDLIVADITVTRPKAVKRVKGVRVVELGASALRIKKPAVKAAAVKPLEAKEEVFKALVLGTSDYAGKNGFKRAVIGLSGGIDSALVAAIAVHALGAKNVTGVFMPSRFTSKESREDATTLAKNLGIELLTVPIHKTNESYAKTLSPVFRGTQPDITEENIQARIRGNILMALSNKFGSLVLTTGNKSEMSVGYATLYGDMAGGFAVIKDVPKTMVYEISAFINERAKKELIPERIFIKAPTAELKFNQTDQDTLPSYEILDPILKAYVEEDKSPSEIIALGFPARVVKKVIRMVDLSEYKRRQAPPGIKITKRALGKDRRMPLTNRYGA